MRAGATEHPLTEAATIVKSLAASLDILDIRVNAATLGCTPGQGTLG